MPSECPAARVSAGGLVHWYAPRFSDPVNGPLVGLFAYAVLA
ncbi:hypothetical protein [Streptomyces sp. NBC_01197]|nr:hypothetical protein OG452_01720 [Streptomyces sp. NBC_01197]